MPKTVKTGVMCRESNRNRTDSFFLKTEPFPDLFLVAGPHCMPQPSPTTWSVFSCCWATTLRWTASMPREKRHSWWLLKTARPMLLVRRTITTLEDITVEWDNWHCLGLTLLYLLADCLELLVSSAKADLTLQDAVKNTALHLACSKVGITVWCHVLTFHRRTCTACCFKRLLNRCKHCGWLTEEYFRGRTQPDEVNEWE